MQLKVIFYYVEMNDKKLYTLVDKIGEKTYKLTLMFGDETLGERKATARNMGELILTCQNAMKKYFLENFNTLRQKAGEDTI